MHWLVGVAIQLSLFAFFILVLRVDHGNPYFYWENDLLVGLNYIMKNNLNSFFSTTSPHQRKPNDRLNFIKHVGPRPWLFYIYFIHFFLFYNSLSLNNHNYLWTCLITWLKFFFHVHFFLFYSGFYCHSKMRLLNLGLEFVHLYLNESPLSTPKRTHILFFASVQIL